MGMASVSHPVPLFQALPPEVERLLRPQSPQRAPRSPRLFPHEVTFSDSPRQQTGERLNPLSESPVSAAKGVLCFRSPRLLPFSAAGPFAKGREKGKGRTPGLLRGGRGSAPSVELLLRAGPVRKLSANGEGQNQAAPQVPPRVPGENDSSSKMEPDPSARDHPGGAPTAVFCTFACP